MTPRLFLQIAGIEARVRMSYRADFWINSVVGVVGEFGLYYFLAGALFAGSGEAVVGGYGRGGMVFYFVAVILIGKLVRGGEVEGAISTDIYEGGLNRYLVFPAAYFPFKYAQHLGSLTPIFLQLVLFWILALAIGGAQDGVHPGTGAIAMSLVSILIGNLLYFLMGYPIQAVAFWADNVWSLEVGRRILAMLLGGAMLPLTMFWPWVQDVLAFLPFRYFYAVPAETLLGRVGVADWLSSLAGAAAWCVVFAIAGRAVFRRGDLQYTGVGI